MEPTIEDELQALAAEVPSKEWENVPRSDDKLVPLARVLEIVDEERQNPYISGCCLRVVLEILRLLRQEFEQGTE